VSATVQDYLDRLQPFVKGGWNLHPASYQLRDDSTDQERWRARVEVWDNRPESHSDVKLLTDAGEDYDSEDAANAVGLVLGVSWLEENAG